MIEAYIDLTEYGAEWEISQRLAAGWTITHRGRTLVIMQLNWEG